jgi:hypothetical protein
MTTTTTTTTMASVVAALACTISSFLDHLQQGYDQLQQRHHPLLVKTAKPHPER